MSKAGGAGGSGGGGGGGGRSRRIRRIDGLLAALAVTGLMSVAATVPHELGHIAVCAAGGHSYTVMMGPMGPMVDCSAVPDPVWLYRAMGGAAGGAMLASMLAWGRLRRSEPWRAGLSASLYLQLAIMVIETAAHPLYMTSPLPTAAVALSSLLIVLSMTGRRPWDPRGRRGAGGAAAGQAQAGPS